MYHFAAAAAFFAFVTGFAFALAVGFEVEVSCPSRPAVT
jgi:hypothetical protein